MSLLNLVVLLLFIFIFWLFWQTRGVAEAAVQHVSQYCEQHQLQMISVSRKNRRLAMINGQPGWLSVYQFEFSGNHEDSYIGTLVLANKYVRNVTVPAYKIH